MNNELQATIRRKVAHQNVERIQLWFTDILGELEVVEVQGGQLDRLLNDGAAHGGLPLIGEDGDDVVVQPDWTTFKILPTSRSDRPSAAVFCSVDSAGFRSF
jgi:glutamine synthetase